MWKDSKLNDWQLLELYKNERSEPAFAELVERHMRMVHATCLRDVEDPGLAEDAAQVVFVILAKKARALEKGNSLAGWLFRTARLVSANIRTQERRRLRREAAMSRELTDANDSSSWNLLNPLLNDAIQSLSKAEQTVLLMRYFEGYNMREIGDILSVSDDAIQKRISRSVDKLRAWFRKHGFTITSVSLIGLLNNQPASSIQLNSTHIAASAAGISHAATLASAGKIGALSEGVLRSMTILNLKLATAATAAIIIAAATGPYAIRAVANGMSPGNFANTSAARAGNVIILASAKAADTPYGVVDAFLRARGARSFVNGRSARDASKCYALFYPAIHSKMSLNDYKGAGTAKIMKDKFDLNTAMGCLLMNTADDISLISMRNDSRDKDVVNVKIGMKGYDAQTIKIVTVYDNASGHFYIDLEKTWLKNVPNAKETAIATTCLSNLKQMALGILMYAQDHGNKFPKADTWVDDILPYLRSSQLFHCPGSPASERWSYAFNRNLSGINEIDIRNPANTPLIFESSQNVKNASDTGESLPAKARHDGTYGYAFADGHARLYKERNVPALQWKP